MDINFQPALLVTLVNLAFTLAFQYVPGLRTKFAELASEVKRQIFLGVGIVVALVWFAFTLPALGLCTPEIGLLCQPTPASALLSALVGLIVGTGGMDGFFNLLPKMSDVEEVKALRLL